jgi:large subunit ribosomal protein L24
MQRLKVGDLVQVISGKDKGKTGVIKRLLKDADKVVVEGIAMVTRHQRPNALQPEGGRIQKEAAIHACKVMPVDPQTNKPTRVRVKVEGDKKVRVAKSGAELTTG